MQKGLSKAFQGENRGMVWCAFWEKKPCMAFSLVTWMEALKGNHGHWRLFDGKRSLELAWSYECYEVTTRGVWGESTWEPGNVRWRKALFREQVPFQWAKLWGGCRRRSKPHANSFQIWRPWLKDYLEVFKVSFSDIVSKFSWNLSLHLCFFFFRGGLHIVGVEHGRIQCKIMLF